MIWVHTPVLPLIAHEFFSQVSPPGSPGFGIVLKVQISFPVRTSNARASPFVLLCVVTVMPFLHGGPDEDDVVDDGRRRVKADLSGLEIDRLAGRRRPRRLSNRRRRRCQRT